MSTDTDEVTEVSKKLDGLVIDVFDTLHQLLAAKSKLEAAMKDGYLFMAKARNVMGGCSSVSSMQYCTDDLNRARVHVDILTPASPPRSSVSDQSQDSSQSGSDQSQDSSQSEASSGAAHFSFIPSRDSSLQSSSGVDADDSNDARFNEAYESPSTDDILGGISLGLRKRVTKGGQIESAPLDPVGEKDKLKMSDKDVKHSVDDKYISKMIKKDATEINEDAPVQASKEISAQSSKDPLLWFGVLVPQSLRSSQGSFVSAVELTFTIATLQAKLLEQRREYRASMSVKSGLFSSSGQRHSAVFHVAQEDESMVLDDKCRNGVQVLDDDSREGGQPLT